MRELQKVYEPSQVEEKIYKLWTNGGYFRGVVDPDKKPFTIVIPPPNVTGQLHLGHAFDNTVQDILIRAKRMQGYAALWVPGTDHAGIATQIRVEEELRKEGLTRYDLGREAFVNRVWQWKEKYGGRIIEQLKLLGSSCDWSRERFTMDEGCSRAVREVFVKLYEKGLIYKGNRIISWCPACLTALSDTEVEHEEQDGNLWYVKYPVKDTGEYVVVATTRPETMLGDTGVAVHPDDQRYSHLVGKVAILPLMEREIPIIADKYVDREFGTGCVKMTPCHDQNDFEVGQRHNLEKILILDEHACVINSGKYNGLARYDARKAVVEDLDALGLLIKIESHAHSVGRCYRCGTTVEPITSPQWFVKMEPLAEPAIEVVKNGRMKFVPERFSKVYLNWMENVRDWCISRQLWWGHQIPAWYCADCGFVTVSRNDPDKCEKCGSAKIERDPDVLDTWFSSALWPFSVFGWPDKTPELEYFYPTTVITPGYEIIFFWVARMIFSGMEHMGDVPFHTAFIHGIVRDDQGRKMSKSLGNGVDPQDIINVYGADALRMNMISGNSPGNDMRFYTEKCEAMRNFANKIWNASRFVMMNLTIEHNELPDQLELEDKWILSKLNSLAGEVCDNLDKYELGVASSKIYDFIWDSYCDWYIELAKPRLQGGGDGAINAQKVLLYVLTETLTLLHPFMPFITEEIWQALPRDKPPTVGNDDAEAPVQDSTPTSAPAPAPAQTPALMVRKYTEYDEALNFPKDEADFESIMAAVKAVRARRAEMNVPLAKKPSLVIVTEKPDVFEAGRIYLGRLAYASEVTIKREAPSDLSGFVSVVTNDARILIPLSELVDIDIERERLEKEIAKTKDNIRRVEQKLSSEQFVSKAPEHVVGKEREKLEKHRALLENLTGSLQDLS
ncbi:MAG: valine--tRNA ligase [Oscillospiraceae bacterium]|nr:valine--tRNA ligase [Oscillospiraceae bacterium]